MVHILDAARYLIYLAHQNPSRSMTQLKLQKLLYLSQGWSYVWDSKLVFPEEFEAWGYGPTNPKIFQSFQSYGRSELPKEEGDDSLSDKMVRETLEAIWEEYGRFSAYELVKLSQEQDPWQEAVRTKTKTISNESIQTFFQKTYQI